jgi:hypothetical protein
MVTESPNCRHDIEYMKCSRCRGFALTQPEREVVTCHVYVENEGARQDCERMAISHVRNTGSSARIHAHAGTTNYICNERCFTLDYADLQPHPNDRVGAE